MDRRKLAADLITRAGGALSAKDGVVCLHFTKHEPMMAQSSKFNTEKADCTVRALAVTCDLTYDVAHKVLTYFGRKSRQGVQFRRVLELMKGIDGPDKCFSFEPVEIWENHEKKWKTVGSFAKAHPKGRYIILVSGHAIPLIDGILVDGSRHPARRRPYCIVHVAETS